MYCQYCGERLPEDAEKCPACFKPVPVSFKTKAKKSGRDPSTGSSASCLRCCALAAVSASAIWPETIQPLLRRPYRPKAPFSMSLNHLKSAMIRQYILPRTAQNTTVNRAASSRKTALKKNCPKLKNPMTPVRSVIHKFRNSIELS